MANIISIFISASIYYSIFAPLASAMMLPKAQLTLKSAAVLAMCAGGSIANQDCNSSCAPFTTSMVEFSSTFVQPSPPTVQNEFQAGYLQHKWDQDLSHITAGYLYISPSQKKVRADEAYQMGLATSLFDFTNTTSSGQVSNILNSWMPSIASERQTFSDYVDPIFPLFAPDTLITNGAVFTGLVDRPMHGKVASWSFLYQGALPVSIFIDNCNVIVGFDFFSPVRRTRVVNEFFNIQVGLIESKIFDLPK